MIPPTWEKCSVSQKVSLAALGREFAEEVKGMGWMETGGSEVAVMVAEMLEVSMAEEVRQEGAAMEAVEIVDTVPETRRPMLADGTRATRCIAALSACR